MEINNDTVDQETTQTPLPTILNSSDSHGIGKTADDIDIEDKSLPYAQLIYMALMSAPSHKMVLSEIYHYFRREIPRFRKAKGKGWMNSIRHNLSMNGVSCWWPLLQLAVVVRHVTDQLI